MHPHLTVILADQRVADIGRCAEQARRARDVRRRGVRSARFRARLALRVARRYADLRTAR
jgi:hypothetical protein